MANLVDTVRETIATYDLITPRDTVLAAVSGGPDSVCMLHVLLGLREELGFELKAAHLDHRFRGDESRRDSDFVQELCDSLGVPCFCEEENVPAFLLTHRLSKQDAARMLRYRYLIKVSKLEYCQRIATGHNADDQAETVLMRVLRGAGPDGLAGIPPKRDGMVIRPLLGVWRSEIEEYLEEHGLPYRTDSSNEKTTCLRNRIRHELLPVLAEYNPAISRSLANLGSIMIDVSSHFRTIADEAVLRVVKRAGIGQFVLDSAILADYDEASQRSVLRELFSVLRPDLGPLPFRHVDGLLRLIRNGEVGGSLELPDGARARLEHGALVLTHGEGPPDAGPQDLPVPGTVAYEGADLEISAELIPRGELGRQPAEASDDEAFFDWDAVTPPLLVRPRREGDRFRPFGLEGTKSLKELFIDSKIAFSFRSSIPLLCDEQGILWVMGLRRSASAPVTDSTSTVLVVRANSTEGQTGTREDPAFGGADTEEGR